MTHDGPNDGTRFTVDGYQSFFHVEVSRSGTYPDWQPDFITNSEHVPGSNRTITQMSGFGLWRIALPIWFDSREAFYFFRKLIGSTGTLTLLAGFTSHEGDITHDLGQDYEAFTNTTLIEPPRDVVLNVGEPYVDCVAVFARAYDPVTNTAVLP